MADKDDFSVDKDQDSGTSKPPAAEGKNAKTVPSRTLLIGLLLVVLGAAAYFYSVEMMAPEEVAVPAAVTKQLITPSASPAKEGETTTQAADSTSTEAVNQASIPQEVPKLAEKGVLKEVPLEAPPAPAPAAVAPTEATVPGAASGQEEVTMAAPTAQPPGTKTQTKPSVVAGKPTREPYTLLAGAYISPDLLQKATRKVKALGYQPRTLNDSKHVEMTRLRIGAFTPEEAQAKLVELKKLAPEAFTLQEGERVAVYAASHYDGEASRAFAERLRQAGVAGEEEKVMVKLPMTELFFGEFADYATAEEAAVKARQAGLDILVFKRP